MVAARVDTAGSDAQCPPVLGGQTGVDQQAIQLLPQRGFRRVAVQHDVLDTPRLLTRTPAHELDFQSILLRIHASGDGQHACRQVIRCVRFALLGQQVGTGSLAHAFEGHPHGGVPPGLFFFGVAPGAQEIAGDLRELAPGRIELIQMKPGNRVLRALGNPLPLREHQRPVAVADQHTAGRADQRCLRQVRFIDQHIGPLQHMPVTAMGARHEIASLVRLQPGAFDPAVPLESRRGHQRHFLARAVSSGALAGQVDRVTFGAGRWRVAIDLVAEQDPDRAAGQARCAVGPGDRQMPAGEVFLENRVARVAAFGIAHLADQRRSVADHRRQTILGEGLSHLDGGLHDQNWRRVEIDEVANQGLQDERLAHLRRGHHDDLLDPGFAERIHDAALIRGTIAQVLAGLRTVLGREVKMRVSPLAHRHRRGWSPQRAHPG